MVVSRSIRQQRRESQCLLLDKTTTTTTVEESDDSKDSGRLSQDEGPTTELSDNGITFGGAADTTKTETESGEGEEAGDEEEEEEDQEESCLLGIDCNEVSTVGLVLRIYADTKIHLDGDG